MKSMKVEKILNKIPKKTGIYQFKDKKGNILYIGKAKDLRKRVKSYFQNKSRQSVRIRKMAEQIEDIDFTVVSTELEAIILESNLIKQHHPKYNIMMRDDKNFAYIKITQNEDFPQISIVRKVLNDGALYFGPKTAAHKAKKTLHVLKKIFPYRHCSLFIEYDHPLKDSYSKTKHKVTVKRKVIKYPCLDFHIKRCIGPCVGTCTKEEYAKIIDNIIMFLKGKSDDIIESLAKEMQKAAIDKNFEKAAKIRDKLHAVQDICEKQIVSDPKRKDTDVINYKAHLGRIYFTLFMIRDGKLISQENFVFKSDEIESDSGEEEEILSSFINQYYEKASDFPKEVFIPTKLTDHKILEEWLSQQKGKKVKILTPQKGEKNKILQLAKNNADSFANHSTAKWQVDDTKRMSALSELKDKLKLKSDPKRIECYDISHISGTNQVAAMIVFENGKPIKKQYRRFKIRTVEEGKPDDFAAMLEVLKRRLLYLMKSKSDIKIKKVSKKDIPEIEKLDKKLLVKGKTHKKQFKAILESAKKDSDNLFGFLKYEKFKDLDYFYDIKCIDKEKYGDLLLSIVQKAVKNRVYVSTKKEFTEESEKVGFRTIKKLPQEIKIKKTEVCLLFDKSKYAKERGFEKTPDLIVIDGGKGQLTQGIKIRKHFNLDIPIVALAKKNEDVYVPNQSFPVDFAKDSEALYLLQQVRDEAHRFALSYHHKLRSKALIPK